MLEIQKNYIINEDNKPIAVQIPIAEFKKIEAILKDYRLVKLIEEVEQEKLSKKQDALQYLEALNLSIPKELKAYLNSQLTSGSYETVADYFLELLRQDCQRQTAAKKLSKLLQEGLDSEGELVTSDYWQNLRMSVLDTPSEK